MCGNEDRLNENFCVNLIIECGECGVFCYELVSIKLESD